MSGGEEAAFQDPRERARACIEAGQAQACAEDFARRLAAGRGGLLMRIALAQCLEAAGDAPRAIAVLQEAVHLAPVSTDVALAFGAVLGAHGSLPAAIAEYQRAARQAPDDWRPQAAMAALWLQVSEWEKALDHGRRARDAGWDAAAFDALERQAGEGRHADRHSPSFVRHLFDQFSEDYDQRMTGRLGYAAPGVLRDLAGMMWGAKPRKRRILDLGCGTGLSGRAFADVARTLIGVDLSPLMLAKAKATGFYDVLHEGDIEAFLDTAPEHAFDAVIAADVLVYLGALERVFQGVRRALTGGGHFLFTVEAGDGDGFELGPKRRYRHGRAYVERLAADAGFQSLSLIETTLRFDAGVPIIGFAALFESPATPSATSRGTPP